MDQVTTTLSKQDPGQHRVGSRSHRMSVGSKGDCGEWGFLAAKRTSWGPSSKRTEAMTSRYLHHRRNSPAQVLTTALRRRDRSALPRGASQSSAQQSQFIDVVACASNTPDRPGKQGNRQAIDVGAQKIGSDAKQGSHFHFEARLFFHLAPACCQKILMTSSCGPSRIHDHMQQRPGEPSSNTLKTRLLSSIDVGKIIHCSA